MNDQTTKTAKIMITALTVAVVASFLLLLPIAPGLAEDAESVEVLKEVDEALGVTELPGPATVHVQVPQTVLPPLTGQPYDPYQQPAAAQDDFRLPSDVRLKRDVRHVATLENGISLYAYKYLWDDTVRIGVLAQDLLAHERYRNAVILMPNGFYAVNYDKLGLKMTTLEAWQAYGYASVMLTPASGRHVSSFVSAPAH